MNDIQDFGKNTKEAVTETFENIQKNMGDYVTRGQEKALKVERKVEAQIQRYPLRAILIAAGAGLLIGLLRRK